MALAMAGSAAASSGQSLRMRRERPAYQPIAACAASGEPDAAHASAVCGERRDGLVLPPRVRRERRERAVGGVGVQGRERCGSG